MFSFNLNQFADSGSGGGKEADYEIPEHFIVILQTRFKVFIICFTNDIFQKSLLLHTNKGKFPFFFANAF